jgi:hypothetical protein
MGSSGYKPQQGENILAMTDKKGEVLSPGPVAPVNETARGLLPDGLKALKDVANKTGFGLEGADRNLEGGFDAQHHRKMSFKAGMIPNLTENPRHRKATKRGRKRRFDGAIHARRMHVERTLAWEDQFTRWLLHFERMQHRHYGMKLMAYTLINLREFCGV